MAFRSKIKNRVTINTRQTLDAKHLETIEYFNEEKKKIPELENELKKIDIELENLESRSKNIVIMDFEVQKKIWELTEKRNELLRYLKKVRLNLDENQYILSTSSLLHNYYQILENEKKKEDFQKNKMDIDLDNLVNSNSISNNISSINELNNNNNNNNNNKKVNRSSVLDWFSNSDSSAIKTDLDSGKKVVSLVKKPVCANNKSILSSSPKNNLLNNLDNNSVCLKNSKNINSDSNSVTFSSILETHEIKNKIDNNKLDHKKNVSKEIIYDKYMKLIDKNYISNQIQQDDDSNEICVKCNVEMLLNQNAGFLVCPKCGNSEKIIIDSDKPSYKEPPKEITSFCYKRINHLNEFLAQFQAKETTDISEDLYKEIKEELKKEKITDMKMITPKKMKEILKKIKRNDYYEHIPYIINQFNGLPAPVIAPEIEEIIRGMFKAIQIPFEKYCPIKRKNFLSYNYVMYKFFELLELDEYLICFQLLKSRTKLYEQDKLWKKICQDLGWEFISSL